ARRLHGKETGHVGFEVEGARDEMLREPPDPRDAFVLRAELRSALEVFATVPERRREIKALQIIGFTYDEIGERLGLSYTRVNALATEANDAIRAELHRRRLERPHSSTRVERLSQLELQPPKWLTAAIGCPPGKHISPQAILAWRRAAIAIDDYRREHGPHVGDDALGKPPAEPRAARSFDLISCVDPRAPVDSTKSVGHPNVGHAASVVPVSV
ncbi:MAG TPA: hypothetical protein VFX80_12530, partial [Solirubrobacteraceae bacterium]|nr:hypothetical protein [Solirubrobacteraceae bacterium]